jgi:hypothetical protein
MIAAMMLAMLMKAIFRIAVVESAFEVASKSTHEVKHCRVGLSERERNIHMFQPPRAD